MKKVLFGVVLAMFAVAVPSSAAEVFLYVDAAPNVYGSPDYPGWLEAAYSTAAGGTFINMMNSVNACNVNTTDIEIEDEVVYSFGTLGKRLTWIYWVPGETIESLTGNFEISLLNTWDGELLDFYLDYYGQTWLEPTKWVEYDADGDTIPDGVIGIAGMAWWGAYGVNTPEALEADLAAWGTARETWEFRVKLFGEITSITSERRPVRVTVLFEQCSAEARNHGDFVSCVAAALKELRKNGVITGQESGEIQSCAGQAVLP
jgi:hypothetical protein